MKTKLLCACGMGFLLLAMAASGQTASVSGSLSIPVENLPQPALWEFISVRRLPRAAARTYHWHLFSGSLPGGLKLSDDGELSGTPQETGQFDFVIQLRDSDDPPNQLQKKFTLLLETATHRGVVAHCAKVNGQRIDGSVKVSNHTGRDFDLTLVVLAVNDIGRATAIGYQRFPLKKKTRDMEIPFARRAPGETTRST